MQTRREFALGAMAAFAFFKSLPGKDVFASAIRPLAGHWLADLDALGRAAQSQKLPQLEWQSKVEELLGKVPLEDFLKYIDFEALEKKGMEFNGKGAKSLRIDFPKAEGVPASLVFGRQLFALKKGRSVVPHGHNNMATAFLILKGQMRGRHYQRHADEPKHLILSPTMDKEFGPGGVATISDVKDNVHWFEALSESAFIFNIHVVGVTPGKKGAGRVYVDPHGEKLEGGKIRSRIIEEDEADKLYG
jgi:hypothetical protein